MSKKIKIEIKNANNLEFYIKEDAKNGDYFCVNDVTNLNLDTIKEFFANENKLQKEELINELRNKEKQNWLNEFKSSQEFLSLKEENINLKNKLESEIRNKELEIQKQYDNKINELNKIIQNNEMEKKLIEQKLINNFNEEKNQLTNKYKNEIDSYKERINTLERNKELLNTKQLGENFETDIFNLLSEHYSMRSNVVYKKQTINNEDSKADFIVQLVDDNNAIYDSITIEAKAIQTHGTKKNSDFYTKLNKDANNNHSSFSILVSELEPHLNFDVFKVREYENMFVVRWQYLTAIIDLMIFILIRKKHLIKLIEEKSISFKEKEKIIEDFESFKSSILNTSLKNIEVNIEKIKSSAENIYKQANNILDSVKVIVDTHINSIKNKIDDFNIQNKIIKKIDKLNCDNEIVDEENMKIIKKIS